VIEYLHDDGVWRYSPEYGHITDPLEPSPYGVPPHMLVAQYPGKCCLCKGELKGTWIEYSPGTGYFNKHLTCLAKKMASESNISYPRTADRLLLAWKIARTCDQIGGNFTSERGLIWLGV
jgi:hypothetical protein